VILRWTNFLCGFEHIRSPFCNSGVVDNSLLFRILNDLSFLNKRKVLDSSRFSLRACAVHYAT
jgi:hypothetical protein